MAFPGGEDSDCSDDLAEELDRRRRALIPNPWRFSFKQLKMLHHFGRCPAACEEIGVDME